MLTEPPLVLDSDFLSSFAWVDRLDILDHLYSHQMLIIDQVFVEINRVVHLAEKVQILITNGSIRRLSMLADEPDALEFAALLGSGRFGAGESACMAYLKYHPGSMGSNNLRDVKYYCETNGKRLLTTGEALIDACENGHLGLDEADGLWTGMLAKRRKLPVPTFSEYLMRVGRSDLLT